MIRSPAYQALLDKLISLEPRAGYSSAAQIGDLTNAQLATVLLHEPTVLADACVGESLLNAVVAILCEQPFNTIERAAMIGSSVSTALRDQARTYLLEQVVEQIATDEERQLADENDARWSRDTRGRFDVLADEYGVASLFVG